jgi:hypothetical protein
VRLRWSTPFGQKTEICETLDASRGGLLVPCKETHAPGVVLWVTFPYDNSPGDGQPEIPATVVRVASVANGFQARRAGENASSHAGRDTKDKKIALEPAVALQFALAPRAEHNGNSHPREQERRASPRRRLALPVRVRTGSIPWFEEVMTLDISGEGVRFLGSREYTVGEEVQVAFESAASAPWTGAKEFRARVVRVERLQRIPAVEVSVHRQG